jgi:hypothetical protein
VDCGHDAAAAQNKCKIGQFLFGPIHHFPQSIVVAPISSAAVSRGQQMWMIRAYQHEKYGGYVIGSVPKIGSGGTPTIHNRVDGFAP